MLCQHLRTLEEAILSAGIAETYRGQPWSRNCRQWAYFNCVLDADRIERTFDLPSCVARHSNDDPKSGREFGFVCQTCHDAVMGLHPQDGEGKLRFPVAGG